MENENRQLPSIKAQSQLPSMPKAKAIAKKKNAARREATTEEKRQYVAEFLGAKKKEIESWTESCAFEIIDIMTQEYKNIITGRWVLTLKNTKDRTCEKCKAR